MSKLECREASITPEAVVGMAVYSARAMLHGKGHDVWEMMVENIP
jgi:pyruvate dehydrogenase (quinone)